MVGDREHELVPICGNEDALVEPCGLPTCVPLPRCRGQVKQRESIGLRGGCEQRGLGPRHDSALDSDLLPLLRVGSDRDSPSVSAASI
jgi:hypothetical protein